MQPFSNHLLTLNLPASICIRYTAIVERKNWLATTTLTPDIIPNEIISLSIGISTVSGVNFLLKGCEFGNCVLRFIFIKYVSKVVPTYICSFLLAQEENRRIIAVHTLKLTSGPATLFLISDCRIPMLSAVVVSRNSSTNCCCM